MEGAADNASAQTAVGDQAGIVVAGPAHLDLLDKDVGEFDARELFHVGAVPWN